MAKLDCDERSQDSRNTAEFVAFSDAGYEGIYGITSVGTSIILMAFG